MAGRDKPRASQRLEQRRNGQHHRELTDLDAEVEREERPAQVASGQLHLPQRVREAEPVDQAEGAGGQDAPFAAGPGAQVVDADVDDAQGNQRLDQCRRRRDHAEHSERKGDAVRDGEGRDYGGQPPETSSEQEQARQEEQVIRTREDVLDARGEEALNGPGARLRRASRKRRAVRGAIEHGLAGQDAVHVQVHERQVRGIVGEQRPIERERMA